MAGDLLLGLQHGEEHPARVRDELEQMIARLTTWANDPATETRGPATFLQPRARYYMQNGHAQSVADSTAAVVTWSADSTDAGDLFFVSNQFDNGALFGQKFLRASGEYLVPPLPGQYLVHAGVAFEANAVGRREMFIAQRTGSGLVMTVAGANQLVVDASYLTLLHVSALVSIAAEADFEQGVGLIATQYSGGPLDLWPGPQLTYLSLIKVS